MQPVPNGMARPGNPRAGVFLRGDRLVRFIPSIRSVLPRLSDNPVRPGKNGDHPPRSANGGGGRVPILPVPEAMQRPAEVRVGEGQTRMNPYLKTKILTASPQELRLMLYEGAIKFCRQAHHAMGCKDWETMFSALQRAQRIVMELNTSLKHDIEPALTEKLAALYTYIYRRLVDANMERDLSPIAECIELLEYQKQTWQMVIARLGEGETDVEPAAAGEPQNPLGRIDPNEASADQPARPPRTARLSVRG